MLLPIVWRMRYGTTYIGTAAWYCIPTDTRGGEWSVIWYSSTREYRTVRAAKRKLNTLPTPPPGARAPICANRKKVRYADAVTALQEEIAKDPSKWAFPDVEFGTDLQVSVRLVAPACCLFDVVVVVVVAIFCFCFYFLCACTSLTYVTAGCNKLLLHQRVVNEALERMCVRVLVCFVWVCLCGV